MTPSAALQQTPTSFALAEEALKTLDSRKALWAQLPLSERMRHLEHIREGILQHQERWADAGNRARGVSAGSPASGQEWIAGVMATQRMVRLLMEAYNAQGKPKLPGLSRHPLTGQWVAHVMPASWQERTLYRGFSAEVWLQPGAEPTQGQHIQIPKKDGAISLVLGAGNVSSIAPTDALEKLFVEGHVCVVKMNPVNDYLGPIFEDIFASLIRDGFFRIVYGGGDVGGYLCQHPLVSDVHITGSHHTHDAIVWGSTAEERARRKAAKDPLLKIPITSELGCVTPCLVVPGDWSESDLRYQVKQIASGIENNASFNCNAIKVLVLHKEWPLRERFLALLRDELRALPPRNAYYPGAAERHQGFLKNYPQAELNAAQEGCVPWTFIPNVPPQSGEYAFQVEAFCGVVAETSIPAENPGDFLSKAVAFANESLWGTLSCCVLIDKKTEDKYKAQLEKALVDLKYGGIGVNCWGAVVYALMVTTWGAHPGHNLDDVGSGIGTVHNGFLLDHPHKSVVRVPFRLFPKPVWFWDHKTIASLAPLLADFEAHPSWGKVPGIVWKALKG